MPRSHDRNPWLRDRLDISAHVKHQGRIVNLLQLRRIQGIFQADDANPGGSHASHFVVRQFHGVAGGQRLRGRGLDAGRLQFGQGRLENVLRPAQQLDQTAAPGGTQSGGQSQGQPG